MGILLAFVTLLTWSCSDLIAKYTLNKRSLWFLSFWGQGIGGLLVLLLGFSLGKIEGIAAQSLPWILFFAWLNFLGMYLFYKSIENKGVALSLPIIYSWPLASIFLNIIFLQKSPTPLNWMGVGLIISGLFAISLKPHKKTHIDRGTLFALLSMLIWGIFYFLIKTPSLEYGEWWLAGSLKCGTALFSLPFFLRTATEKSQEKVWKTTCAVSTMGFFDGVGLLTLSLAFVYESATVVEGISATAPVLVAFFGVLLFKESITKTQGLGIFAAGLGLLVLIL